MENPKQIKSNSNFNTPEIDWIFKLREEVPQFLEKLRGKKSGFFHYSLSGDLYDENIKWGLGNTVFAIKIYYTLNLLNSLTERKKRKMADFVKSFQQEDGTIYDPLIKKLTFWRDKLSSFKNLNFNNFFHQGTIRAETRQAISALSLLGEKLTTIPYLDFPKTEKEINRYLSKLNWEKPWSAGSHFSHLLFFLKNSNLVGKGNLIDYAISWLNEIQNPEDGAWYKGKPNLREKINGAMKVISGLKAANKTNFNYPEKLIDLCLSAKNDKHACDNFNIIYVLKHANELLNSNYRHEEIKKFALQRLNIYKKYYYPKIGGFSFFLGKANDKYYGAKITKGLNEPDIHGTCMFLWGISIISQILDIKLKYKEQIP